MITDISRSVLSHYPLMPIADILYHHLAGCVTASGMAWLTQILEKLLAEPSEMTLFTGFSAAPRQVGKADLQLSDADLKTALTHCPGWDPADWSVDQATRTLLLLSFPADDADRYVAAVEKLFSAADLAEQVALYQSLPVLPHPNRFLARAIEGLRTNMTAVFNAIALHNPYPAKFFDEAAWNQIVLKALFVDSKLSQIQGLDERANANLARMLSDYAHERWAAGRHVNPQLWRSLGYWAEGELVLDLARVLEQGDDVEQQAAALACATAPDPAAQVLLAKVPKLKQQIAEGQLTWAALSQMYP